VTTDHTLLYENEPSASLTTSAHMLVQSQVFVQIQNRQVGESCASPLELLSTVGGNAAQCGADLRWWARWATGRQHGRFSLYVFIRGMHTPNHHIACADKISMEVLHR
jgi:hypothetical protein